MASKNEIQLGELESEVMAVVWDKGEATVHDVLTTLQPRRELAYTTVMTVMSRLAKKGLLRRRKVGKAYLYEPADSQAQVAGSLLRRLVDRLYEGAAAAAIAHLLESDEAIDEAELDRLEALIQAKREQQSQ